MLLIRLANQKRAALFINQDIQSTRLAVWPWVKLPKAHVPEGMLLRGDRCGEVLFADLAAGESQSDVGHYTSTRMVRASEIGDGRCSCLHSRRFRWWCVRR